MDGGAEIRHPTTAIAGGAFPTRSEIYPSMTQIPTKAPAPNVEHWHRA
jgi:hypothetical protein